jgi:Integrase core domain/HTH-like domain
VTRYVEERRDTFGVEPICAALGVPVSTHYARRSRKPSRRELADRQLLVEIEAARSGRRRVYGARKTWKELRRREVEAGRDQVARVMREHGLVGKLRGSKKRTTIPDEAAAERARDLLQRDFTATAPNEKWLADLTYIRAWSGFVYLAFILDCYSRRIVGWQLQTHMRAELVLDALEMANGLRRPQAGLIAHSDRGSQGGFNWSSQHLVMEVLRDGCWQAAAGDSSDARSDVVAGAAVGGASGGPAVFLASDRCWVLERGRGRRRGGVASGWQPMVPRRWRDAANLVGAVVGAVLVVC